jgi:hypothetical protein
MVITRPSGSTSITIDSAIYESASELRALAERYRRLYGRRTLRPSDSTPEIAICVPSLAAQPVWLEKVQAAIRDSVAEGIDNQLTGDAGRITPDAARAAVDFFERTADLFSDEPHLYPSLEGDLIAEIGSKKGRLTTIVSGSTIILFGAAEGLTFERQVSDARLLRSEVQRVIKRLDTIPHGNVETEAR